jgi:hypothetical protein
VAELRSQGNLEVECGDERREALFDETPTQAKRSHEIFRDDACVAGICHGKSAFEHRHDLNGIVGDGDVVFDALLLGLPDAVQKGHDRICGPQVYVRENLHVVFSAVLNEARRGSYGRFEDFTTIFDHIQ